MVAPGGYLRPVTEAPGRFACFDVETTGLDANNCRILEIAVVHVDDGRVVDEWTTLLDPGGVDVGPTHIHGITRRDLDGAPTFAEVAGDLLDRIQDRVPVAHNAPFDVGFINAEWGASQRTSDLDLEPGRDALDTLTLARRLGLPGRLGALAEALGVDLSHAHRALDDTRALAEVLVRLLGRADDADVSVPRVEPYFFPGMFPPKATGRAKVRPSAIA